MAWDETGRKNRTLFHWILFRHGDCDASQGPSRDPYSFIRCYSLSVHYTAVEAFWKSWISCSWASSCSRDICSMVSGHVCHPWRELPGGSSGEYNGSICQSHGGAWWYAPFLYTILFLGFFPWSGFLPVLNVSDPQGLETVSNRRAHSHTGGRASPIRGPLGHKLVPLFYSFGHQTSTLYFPTVSSSGDPCGLVLVTMPQPNLHHPASKIPYGF